ncbi:ibr domain-containing protein [Colletotrichum sojae]|uniref:Ibr domain-containing protein n=1 Tax=Colletotrichum sojae TaxID=2175907 RepID=A0A8H6N054_9PEZI|nr:ibr domain-containing protein [Colletotrichum sojae]
MAYRDVHDWPRRTTRRPYPPNPHTAAQHDWLSAPESSFDTVLYRRPKDIQGPGEVASSHGRSRSRISRTNSGSGASATVVETMHGMPKTPTTPAYRRGRYPVTVPDFEYDSYGEEGLPEPQPLGGRRRSPTRGRSPRSALQQRPRRTYQSWRSSTSSLSGTESETDEESATSVSTQEEKRQRRRDRARREKDRSGEPARRPPVEDRRPPADEKKPRRRRRIREIVYVEEDDDDSTEPNHRRSLDERSSSPPRHRSRVSRSASERRYTKQRSRSPVRGSSHHRPSPKTYKLVEMPPTSSRRLVYGTIPARDDSDLVPTRHTRRRPTAEVVYADAHAVRRSRTASGASHVTSHSTASSSKRPPSFPRHLATGSVRSNSPEKTAKRGRFKLSTSDPQSMPPKCCSSDLIPLKHVEHLLSDGFKMKWNRKYLEFTTRNRIYCPSSRCNEWIRPDDIYRRGSRQCGRCCKCKTEVCCSCKGKWHSSRDCPHDEDTTRFLEQAKEAGWQRCYKCNHMVELEEGRCGAQFCMICGVKWKNCECPWFNYETAATDELLDLRVPAPTRRMARLDHAMTSRGVRPTVRPDPPPRSRSQDYDDRLVRRFQENRGDEHSRRLSSYEDITHDGGYADVGGIGNTVGHFMDDGYHRDEDVFVAGPPVPPAPTPPAAFERPVPTDYMSGVNRARGLPQDSMGQRLAERFSELRTSPGGPRTGMMGLPSLHTAPPPTPMATSPMGPPPPLTAPMGLSHQPPIPMLRRHTFDEEPYNTSRSTRPLERMVLGRMPHDYERDETARAPRNWRRQYTEPKSSTLAGLTGPGRGMNRVFEWRNHVHPGAPDGDGIRA